MKKIKYLISSLVVGGMLLSVSLSAAAAVSNKAIYIYPNYAWTSDTDNTDARSGSYNSVYAKLESIRPTENHIGIYQKAKVRVTNGFDVIISDTYTLSATASSNTVIPINTNLSNPVTIVGFEFQGNTANDAYATVSYSGR